MSSVSVTSKCQVTIPKRIRQALGIKTGSKLEFEVAGNEARLKLTRNKVAVTRVEDGIGMLKYRGPRISLADMDVAMRLHNKK